ncbi:hypothetical protein DPV78_006337 [Talaromyces pinophilus]|nr:hypothetical protein DPV78_006337 [Talaromyces pinophilus]
MELMIYLDDVQLIIGKEAMSLGEPSSQPTSSSRRRSMLLRMPVTDVVKQNDGQSSLYSLLDTYKAHTIRPNLAHH